MLFEWDEMKFKYNEFLDIALKWSQNCSNRRYSSSAVFYKEKCQIKQSLVLICENRRKKQKTIVTKLPDKKLQFQLSPCYILQKRLGGDQHYAIPAPMIPKKKKTNIIKYSISTKPIEHKKANSGKPTFNTDNVC